MRKCHSCGKGVPVGALRCIYCGTDVSGKKGAAPAPPPAASAGTDDDFDFGGPGGGAGAPGVGSQTLFGIPAPAARAPSGNRASAAEPARPARPAPPDEAVGSSTMFGVPTRGVNVAAPTIGSSRGAQAAAQQPRRTMMGLASVKLISDDDDPNNNPRATMAGMPVVSAQDLQRARQARNATSQAPPAEPEGSRHTMFGMPAVRPRGAPNAAPVVDEPPARVMTRGAGPAPETNNQTMFGIAARQAPPSRASQASADDDDDFSGFSSRNAATRPANPHEVKTIPAPAPQAKAIPAPAPPDDDDDFDPLQGLDGAQQHKISSLIDEEVEDISTSIFGEGFAFGSDDFDDDDDDDDDDDWDAPPSKKGAKQEEPEDSGPPVVHDFDAAEAALADMMADLESVMPSEDEAAAALGLDDLPPDGSMPVGQVVRDIAPRHEPAKAPAPEPVKPQTIQPEPVKPQTIKPEPLPPAPIKTEPLPPVVPTETIRPPSGGSRAALWIVLILVLAAAAVAVVMFVL